MNTADSHPPGGPHDASVAPSSVVDPSLDWAIGRGVIQLLNLMLRERWLIIGVPVALAFVVGLQTFLQPRTYTSSASFQPQQPPAPSPSALSGLAAQFGLNGGGGRAAESPEFYTDLLTSDEILRRAVGAEYSVPTDSGMVVGPLAKFYEIEEAGAEATTVEAIEILRGLVNVQPNPRTSVVRISVSTWWPELSQQLVARLIRLVNEFNLDVRQSTAEGEREFVEGRLAQSRAELADAESRYETFLSSNRQFDSPQLSFERDRHEREVDMLQQVVTSLLTSYEQARIEEVRNTPAISVLDPGRVPVTGNARGTLWRAFLAGLGGGLAAIVLAVGKERARLARADNDPDFAEFLAHGRSLVPAWILRRSRGT